MEALRLENSANIVQFNQGAEIQVAKKTVPSGVRVPVADGENLYSNRAFRTPVSPLSVDEYKRLRDYFFGAKNYFYSMQTNKRNYLYIVMSVNLMRRAGDMVQLRVGDVVTEDGSFRDHVIIREQKTGKVARVYLNDACREALVEYLNGMDSYAMSDWLFENFKRPGEHMSVDGMRRMLKRTAEKLGMDIHIGTHSLRKTLPHHAMSHGANAEDEVAISQLLNHSNIKTTYHYIGREQEELDNFVQSHAL